MSMADYPFVTIDVHDIVRSQFLYVYKRQGSEADKDEDVTNKGEIVVVELNATNNIANANVTATDTATLTA